MGAVDGVGGCGGNGTRSDALNAAGGGVVTDGDDADYLVAAGEGVVLAINGHCSSRAVAGGGVATTVDIGGIITEEYGIIEVTDNVIPQGMGIIGVD